MGRVMLLLVVLSAIIFLAGCQQPKTCGENYYEYEPGECCPDTDGNKVCDNAKAAENSEGETLAAELPDQLLADDIYENSRDSVFLIVTNCTFSFEYRDFYIATEEFRGKVYPYIVQLDNKVQTFDHSIYTGSSFKIGDKLVTNVHVIQCLEDEEEAYYLLPFWENVDDYEKGIALERSRLSESYYLKYESVLNSMLKHGSPVGKEGSESYLIAMISSYLLENAGVNVADRKIYALHERDGFATREEVRLDTAGRAFPGKDFAILSHNGDGGLRLEESTSLEIGQEVHVIGFPAIDLQENNETQGFIVQKDPPIITSGILGNEITSSQNVKYFVLDASAYSGSSGGPVLNSNGKVIGILTAGLTDIGEFTYALPIYETPLKGEN